MTTAPETYTIKHDPADEDGLNWSVVDAAGDEYDRFETEREALACAAELTATAIEEAEEDEAGCLRDSITERLDDLNLDALRKLAKHLGI